MDLVFDTNVLSGFARAKLLDTLQLLTASHRRLVPQAVIDELSKGELIHPELKVVRDLDWLTIVRIDGLDGLRAFSKYTARFGTERNFGEAAALAYAEVHGAIAVTDDQAAVQFGRQRRVQVWRTLALIAGGIRRNVLDDAQATEVVHGLIQAGSRFPKGASDFMGWARREGLLS